jgi:general secretion pathway protein K
LPTFLCGMQRKVGAAPHRGNANRPLANQGKAPKPEARKKAPRRQKNPKSLP